MGTVNCRRRKAAAAAVLAVVLFAAAVVAATARPVRLPATALARRRIDSSTPVAMATRGRTPWTTATTTEARSGGGLIPPRQRRWLAGPGSSPPTCRARCGRCAPCRAARVAIQPGAVGPQWEYYPEVWRCKCGDKLFMP